MIVRSHDFTVPLNSVLDVPRLLVVTTRYVPPTRLFYAFTSAYRFLIVAHPHATHFVTHLPTPVLIYTFDVVGGLRRCSVVRCVTFTFHGYVYGTAIPSTGTPFACSVTDLRLLRSTLVHSHDLRLRSLFTMPHYRYRLLHNFPCDTCWRRYHLLLFLHTTLPYTCRTLFDSSTVPVLPL